MSFVSPTEYRIGDYYGPKTFALQVAALVIVSRDAMYRIFTNVEEIFKPSMISLTMRASRASLVLSLRALARAPQQLRALSAKAEIPEQVEPTKRVNIDRELPDPFVEKRQNRRYFWIYGIGVTLLCVLIFNYEKTNSPIINSVLYCLRRSEIAKNNLGTNISFASSYPWIWGPLNTVQGNIDVTFDVKGDHNSGTMKLKATRTSKLVPFDILHWTLEVKNGPTIDLLNDPSVDFEL